MNNAAAEDKEQYFQLPKPESATELPKNLGDKVLDALVAYFWDGYTILYPTKTKDNLATELNTLLQETGAIVSGGFILKALGLYPMELRRFYEAAQPDVDIYVSCANVVHLYEILGKWLGANEVISYKQSKYCASFLKRNGIRRVYTFTNYDASSRRGRRNLNKSMDIMSVRNARNVIDVVKNFDLTFCMNWYDGEKLYSMYPKHLDHKIGLLQGDYVKMFLGGNRFLKARLNKYINRKFEIRLDPEVVKSSDIIMDASSESIFCKVNKPERNDVYYSTWASKAFFEFFITNNYICLNKTNIVKGKASYNTFEKIPIFKDDGYDSDEYVIQSPDDPKKETVKAKLVELAVAKAANHDPTLAPLTPEEKFWHLVTRCICYFYSNSGTGTIVSPFLKSWKQIIVNNENETVYTSEADLQEILNRDNIKPCLDALKGLFTRIDMDPVSLDDVQVYDFHAHKSDQGASKETIDNLLNVNKAIQNKDEIPCYITAADGCGRYLTRNDMRPFATPEIFNVFVSSKQPIIPIPLGELTDWGAILQNDASATNSWGAINKHTMCPFCLRQEERNKGCAYMVHAGTGSYDTKKMPYCSPQEQVKELWQKYKEYQKELPLTNYGTVEGLEYCAICGRPCHGHAHFDLENPGEIIVNPNYGMCPGGGRPELIARMLAIRAVLLEHKDDEEPDHAEIRREAAFAADEAPLDAELMERARAIFAQEAASRKFNNVGLNEYSSNGAPPPLSIGRRRGNNGDEEVKVGEDGEALLPEIEDGLASPDEINNGPRPPAPRQDGIWNPANVAPVPLRRVPAFRNPLVRADAAPALDAAPNPGVAAQLWAAGPGVVGELAAAAGFGPAAPAAPAPAQVGLNPENFSNNNNNNNNNNLEGGLRRITRGRRKSAMKKRLRTQRVRK